VPRVVICPTCQAKGAVPDHATSARIRCPKCGNTFDASAAAGSGTLTSQSQSQVRGPAAAPKRSKAASSAYEDLENAGAAPLPSLSGSGFRRSPSSPAPSASQSGSTSPVLYALLGVSGVAVLLLGVLVVVLMRPSGPTESAAKDHGPALAANPEPTAPAATPVAVASPPAAASLLTADRPPPPAAESSSSDPQTVIKRLKEATVFLKAKVKGRYISSGSGFVIEVRGNDVLLATNRHVAVPDLSEVPERIAPRGAQVETDAVFYSGEGPQLEQTVPAGIVAANLSEDLNTDLAFMVCRGVKRPPRPIDITTRLEPLEGMAYIGAGYPLSDLINKIADAHGNPTVTITHGHIASRKLDDQGQVSLLQVDGSLHPGNSGGPIVDERTGRLLGVAVASLTRIGVSNVGFIVPAAEVRHCLDGRVGSIDLTLNESPAGTANLLVKAQVVDPNQKVQGVMVFVAASSQVGAIRPNSDGSWPPLPNISPVELQRDNSKQIAQGHVRVALSGQGAAARKVTIQTAHRDTRGRTIYSKPKEVALPDKPGRIRAPGAMERVIASAKKRSFAMLGPLTDPDKDCKLTKEESQFKIRLQVPGNKIHSLSPELVTRFNKRKSLHNSPMTLADVDGDFVAMVEVTGDMNPGTTLPKDRQGNQIPFTFHGAGLLLYQDRNNFVRLERTAGTSLEDAQPIHKVLLEIVTDGILRQHIYFDLPDSDIRLILIRRKGKLRCQFGSKSDNKTYQSREFAVEVNPKVKVGLSAANISSKLFSATFENFVLLNDSTTVDEEFGK
jgi:S1-C subfamily serine protease/regulation of enolase protein 1 (concanavalin A-like superfamily)